MEEEATRDQSIETAAQNSRQAAESKSDTRTQRPRAKVKKSAHQQPGYTATIFPGDRSTIPPELAEVVLHLETAMSEQSTTTTHIWLLIQSGKGEVEAGVGGYGDLNEDVRREFFSRRAELSQDARVVLLIDSLGGSAKSAYQLATFFQRHCGGFVALVPRIAKSAATLLAIGADKIILGTSGELGPVDAQVRERDDFVPALDRVKSLERLHASALEAVDRTMALLTLRSGEDVEKLLPLALDFAARLSQPYLQETDMLDYTRMSRVLKIGEDYASRLLERQYEKQESKQSRGSRRARGNDQPYSQSGNTLAFEEQLYGDYSRPGKRKARLLAQHLVGAYPDHAFAIDVEEARRIGLEIHEPSKEIAQIIDEVHQVLADHSQENVIAIGRVKANDD
jgi:hypothetical protein